MSNKLTKPNKKDKKQSGTGFIAVLVCVVVVSIMLIFSKKTNATGPMTNPEAIAFSYNAETGEVEAEDLGNEFRWQGYWQLEE